MRDVAALLPSLDEALERADLVNHSTLDRRDATRLAAWLPAERLTELGLTLKEGATWEPLEWSPETFREQFASDVAFGFKKALNQRGISASIMYEVVEMWLRVLGVRDQFTHSYAQYGLPLFKQVAVEFGLPNPIGDDTGTEREYADY